MTTTTTTTWTAWRRLRGERMWRAVAHGDSEGAASRALHEYLREVRDSGDCMVLPPGEWPAANAPVINRGYGRPGGRPPGNPARQSNP